ncbi:MAG: hypothetical protein A2146_06295 [Actinobacteria bacterium RBG_16_67_10]|nr:MAG: hypothetical protein A2146_06295 [Actinobacteria bacterium RBG_16_67_10]
MMMQAWLSGAGDLIQRIRPYLGDLLLGAGLVLAGSLLGRLLARWGRRAARAGLDRMARRSTGAAAVGAAELGETVPELVGRFAYWLVLLVFMALALDVFGVPVVRSAGERLADSLPGAVTALVIVFVGVIVASLAGGIVAASAASAGVAYAGAVGRAVQASLVILALLSGLEQIGVHGEFFVVLIWVVVGTLLGGAALAFGLGARTAVSNIVGAHYVAQMYSVGQTVRVGETEGRIVRTTSTAVVLDTPTGVVQVPARLFTEQPSVLIPESRLP